MIFISTETETELLPKIQFSLFQNQSSLYIVSVAALSSVAPQPCCVIGKATQAEQTLAMQTDDKLYSWVAECSQCNISFGMTKNLKKHMLQHDRKKPHSCKQCGYSTIKTDHLKRHMYAGSQQPFDCMQCNCSCTQAGALKEHMVTHTGETNFSCTQCNYFCTRAGNLKKHMLTHSGEKPFSCDQCDYFFYSSSESQGAHANPFRRKTFQMH